MSATLRLQKLPSLSYLSLEDLSVDVIVGFVLPPFNTSAIYMGRKSKLGISRGANLDSVAV
jgi:hypothetical protein